MAQLNHLLLIRYESKNGITSIIKTKTSTYQVEMSQLKSNSFLFINLIFLLFLSSCEIGKISNTNPIQSPIASTETITSFEMIETFTPFPTSTLDIKKQSRLIDVILKPNDMFEEYPIFESEQRWAESTDLTNELIDEKSCELDCAKQVWSPRIVEIVLIESSTPEEAIELLENTKKTFSKILEIKDRPYLLDLSQNAWAIYEYSNNEFVLLYSYGPIFVHIMNRPAAGFDDFAGEFDLLYALGKLQLDYLSSNGYTH